MDEAKPPLCISVIHESRELFGRRFHLSDGYRRGYAVWLGEGLGFRICSGERVAVRVAPSSVAVRIARARPQRLDAFLDGEHRGFIRRSAAASFRRDVLVLDGREHDLPRWMERETGFPGVELWWGSLGSRPSICVAREEDLLIGLLILTYVYVRAMVRGG